MRFFPSPIFIPRPLHVLVLLLRLELELVNLVTPGEAEGRLQVLGEVVNLLDVGKQSGVNGLQRSRRIVVAGLAE